MRKTVTTQMLGRDHLLAPTLNSYAPAFGDEDTSTDRGVLLGSVYVGWTKRLCQNPGSGLFSQGFRRFWQSL